MASSTLDKKAKKKKKNGKSSSPSSAAGWTTDAPKTIRRDTLVGEAGKGWQAWVNHLQRRKSPVALEKACAPKSKTWPLVWALPQTLVGSPTEKTIEELACLSKAKPADIGRLADQVQEWSGLSLASPLELSLAFESLAVAHALPALAEQLAAEDWWEVLGRLVKLAQQSEVDRDADPLVALVLGGELPLTLAYLFPEYAPCAALAETARHTLSEGLTELLDGEGLPHADLLPHVRVLLGCFTRSHALSLQQQTDCFSDEAHLQYEWLLRNALMFSRGDGTHAFAQEDGQPWNADLLAAALEFAGNRKDRAAAALALPAKLLPGKPKKNKSSASLEAQAPWPATDSEWSAVSMLRSRWARSGERLAVTYADRRQGLDLDTGRGLVLSGEWQAEISIDGELLAPVDEWKANCWESDDDVDYLELELPLSSGVTLQRQILLAREQRFLYLCDVILGESKAAIEYRGSLPLAAGVQFVPEADSREGHLVGKKKLGLVMPLALPEWRSDPRHGQLAARGEHLVLQQSANGENLACPILIDLKPRRLSAQRTWRQLTVAEKLEIQPADVAVGYRAQCGSDQWLFFRTMGARGNRTVLGQNLISEFLAGVIDEEGDVDTLVEIE